jgi:hypothetical protein
MIVDTGYVFLNSFTKKRFMIKKIATTILESVVKLGKLMPDNDYFKCYTIESEGSPYLTRVLLPRLFGCRPMIHRFHRPDKDFHNHPWEKAISIILVGGYIEVRSHANDTVSWHSLKPFSINKISRSDFHKVAMFLDDQCWTLFIAGKRVEAKEGEEWGFRSPDGTKYTPWKKYISNRRRHNETYVGSVLH